MSRPDAGKVLQSVVAPAEAVAAARVPAVAANDPVVPCPLDPVYVAAGEPIGAVPRGLTIRLAHLFAALFTGLLLIVPTAYTVCSAAACVAAFICGFRGWLRQARASLPRMASFVIPCLVFLAVMLVCVIADRASSKYTAHLIIAGLSLWVGLSGVPGRMPDIRRWLLPAAAVGAIAALALAGWQVVIEGHTRAMGLFGWGQNWSGAVKFGAMASVQGLLSLVLFITSDRKWRGRRSWRRYLGVVGFLASAGTLALTQARGGLVGYLLGRLALTWVSRASLAQPRPRDVAGAGPRGRASAPSSSPASSPARERHPGHFRSASPIVLAGLIACGLAVVAMENRFADIKPQIERYERGDASTEVGQRLALWEAAGRAITHAPLTGSGFGRFMREIERQRASGEIPAGIQLLYGQTHNEYLASFVDGGIVAGLATVAMFLLPPLVLLRRLTRHPDAGPAAYAALAVGAAFAGFALTDNVFDRQLTVIAFYFLMNWLLAAAAVQRSVPARVP
ncbi:MAG: O-antigen ligase family protein [Burkholderiaceae bacterium]